MCDDLQIKFPEFDLELRGKPPKYSLTVRGGLFFKRDATCIQELAKCISTCRDITSVNFGSLFRSGELESCVGLLTNIRTLHIFIPRGLCHDDACLEVIKLIKIGNLQKLFISSMSDEILGKILRMRTNLRVISIDRCNLSGGLEQLVEEFIMNNPIEKIELGRTEIGETRIHNIMKYRSLKKIRSWQTRILPEGDAVVIAA